MSRLSKKIIKEALNKNPVAIKEAVDQALSEKCKEIIESVKPELGNLIVHGDDGEDFEYNIDEEEEAEAFFEEFHAEYGHLPLDEQLDILDEHISEIDEDEEIDEDQLEEGAEYCNRCDKPYKDTGGGCPGCAAAEDEKWKAAKAKAKKNKDKK